MHTVLYGVGLDDNNNLVYSQYQRVPHTKGKRKKKKDFLFPVKKLTKLYKDILFKSLSELYEYTGSPWLDDLNAAKRMRWQVQICNPLFKPDTVIEYLGRYVNRTSISNSRIKSYDGEFVEFTYKDYKENSKIKTMKLKDTEFLARFARHIPPAHFTRIRHYGFLGNSAKEKLARVKELTGSPDIVCERTTDEILREKRGENYLLCKKCQGETVVEHEEHKPWWTREFIVRRLGELKENRQNHPFLTAKRGVQIVSEKD